MKARQWMKLAVVTSAIGLTGSALAADGGAIKVTDDASTRAYTRNTDAQRATDSMTTPLGQTPETAGVGSNDQSPNSNFDTWMNRQAGMHNGRITREEFMTQMGHRWDMMDAHRQGYLTPDQTRGIYMSGESVRTR